jgi:hypothetical protein
MGLYRADWTSYRGVVRLGRKTRLREDWREVLWSIFEGVRAQLAQAGQVIEAGMFSRLAGGIAQTEYRPYDFAIVDEAQDASVSQLHFFAALGGIGANALLFCGGPWLQRILQRAPSWKALGVDVCGRAKTLRINCRTSHQIRSQADRLLESDIADADGNTQTLGDAISVFNGALLVIQMFANQEAEIGAVGACVAARVTESVAPQEIRLVVRSDTEIPRARAGIEAAGILSVGLRPSADALGKGARVSGGCGHGL